MSTPPQTDLVDRSDPSARADGPAVGQSTQRPTFAFAVEPTGVAPVALPEGIKARIRTATVDVAPQTDQKKWSVAPLQRLQVWMVSQKFALPRMSPELRDGLLKHGRRVGMGIGNAIDKIIRDVPERRAGALVVRQPDAATTLDAGVSADYPEAKQPSIFAPAHIITALLAGGIIHIATTFAITSFGTGSAFRQLRAVLPANELVVLPAQTPATQLLPFLSPDMLYAMCRFDLAAGSLEVKATLPEAGWSLALYNRSGDNFYAAPGQALRPVPVAFVLSPASDRLVNLTPGVRKSDVDINQVTSPDSEGLLVLRAPLKGVAFENAARAELKRASCGIARK